MSKIKRNCNNCSTEYLADTRDIKRGWGLCCSKSCAASHREKSKPGYNPERVKSNNIRRVLWNDNPQDDYDFDIDEDERPLDNYDPGDSEYWDNSDNWTY